MTDYKSEAKALLKDNATPAMACLKATDILLGFGWYAWEPETVWLTLEREHNVSVPAGNQSQLMAARNLLTSQAFFYDAEAFAKTCVAFSNDEPLYNGMDDACVHHIAWTNEEAYKIFLAYTKENNVYDREPVEYTAVQLYREGFVVAPDQLHWAQDRLDKYYHKDTLSLKKDIRESWAGLLKGDHANVAFPETPLGVQLAKLSATQKYCDERKAELTKALGSLGL